jgi:hypothetical protein
MKILNLFIINDNETYNRNNCCWHLVGIDGLSFARFAWVSRPARQFAHHEKRNDAIGYLVIFDRSVFAPFL